MFALGLGFVEVYHTCCGDCWGECGVAGSSPSGGDHWDIAVQAKEIITGAGGAKRLSQENSLGDIGAEGCVHKERCTQGDACRAVCQSRCLIGRNLHAEI